MIYPIFPYGEPVLRQKATLLKPGTNLQAFIEDMFATMDAAHGLGLAAPQIGTSLQLFVVDLRFLVEDGTTQPGKYRKVYINPSLEILDQSAPTYAEEGCLSIPGIYIQVPRSTRVRIKFFDSNWQSHTEELLDMPARAIQHEYDHLQGKLHIDYMQANDRLLLEPKLENIRQGNIKVGYQMYFKAKG